jgi:hypothetical protein
MAAHAWGRRITAARAWLATPGDAGRTLRVLAWALALPFLKRGLPLRTLVRLLWSTPQPGARRDPQREARLISLIGWLYRPDRVWASANCLERSLLLYHFFGAGGADPRLVVGMTRGATRFRGHAWVIVDGQPVGETEADMRAYTPLVTFGAGGRVVRDEE